MNKPISLRINELLKTGKVEEAFTLATAAHRQYPKIKMYEKFADTCEARLPRSRGPQESRESDRANRSNNQIVDYGTLEYHLKKILEKIRSRELSAIKAWNDISFLAPSWWPKDPRLSRLIAPTSAILDLLRQQDNNKILILSGDITGGAGIAALRTYECLNSIGQKTDILYRENDAFYIKGYSNNILQIETKDLTPVIYDGFDLQLIEELRSHIAAEVHLAMSLKGKGSNTFLFHSEESLDIKELSKLYKGVNIHWTDFLLTSASLERIKDSEIPITLTLHDMYWLNGSCHYSAGCTQYLNSCASCPLVTRESETIALFNLYHEKTLKSLRDVSIISPSQWLCGLAIQSKAMSCRDTYFILNPQANKVSTRPNKSSHDEHDPITIIYGALGLSEKRKGYDLFVSVCREITERGGNIRFKVFGSLTAEQKMELELFSCEVLGFLSQKDLSNQFSKSDAMLMISHEDNYPNLCVEASALGLPVIASNNSGLKSFIEVSEGGILVGNCALEIVDTIMGLTKSELNRLGSKIFAWCKNCYNNTDFEKAYQSVILRESDHKRYLCELTPKTDLQALSHTKARADLFCEYVTTSSEFAIEILVPVNKFANDRYTLSYTLQEAGLSPLDLYIEGYQHYAEATLNSDNQTYKIDNLPAGKTAKLVKSDSTSGYFYRQLKVSAINVFPIDLAYKNIQRTSAFKQSKDPHASSEGIILCDDSIVFEQFNGSAIYWLISNRRYSLHFHDIPLVELPMESELSSSSKKIITFHTLDLRHEPASQIKLEINTPSQNIQLMPSIEDDKFFFCIERHLINSLSSYFLITGPGEMLEDGREVVALINAHSTLIK